MALWASHVGSATLPEPEVGWPALASALGSPLKGNATAIGSAEVGSFTPLGRVVMHWFTEDRARAWLRVLAVMTAFIAILWIALSSNGVDLTGKPLGTDFIAFWTA